MSNEYIRTALRLTETKRAAGRSRCGGAARRLLEIGNSLGVSDSSCSVSLLLHSRAFSFSDVKWKKQLEGGYDKVVKEDRERGLKKRMYTKNSCKNGSK